MIATRVKSDSDDLRVADIIVGFKSLREKFTSRVHKQRPEHIEVHYVDGPMRDLDNRWIFRALPDGGCEVEFFVEFTFRNRVFEAMAGQYFDRAFRRMVAAFETRADGLSGRSEARRLGTAGVRTCKYRG